MSDPEVRTLLSADRILLMDGADAAVGSHAQLLARQPLYADLIGYWENTASHPSIRTST